MNKSYYTVYYFDHNGNEVWQSFAYVFQAIQFADGLRPSAGKWRIVDNTGKTVAMWGDRVK